MASYDYECPGDGEIVTINRPMSEPEGEYFCTTCGAKLKRVFTPNRTIFKATGFYSTDNYRK